jgi:nucleoside-diphosphate-sugar epimerase
VGAEEAFGQMDLGGMTVSCLRFATACGFTERLRLDLVLNDFVACALTSGKITVLSDGTPWRPLIDVQDMALALEWAAFRDKANGGRMLIVNVGSDERNHQVRDLARAVAENVPGSEVSINAAAPPDARSYRVDFSLYRDLAPAHQPRVDLARSVKGLVDGLRAISFSDAAFRASPRLIRLNTILDLEKSGRLTADLRWRGRG